MRRTDTAVRVISASPDRVFAALTDSDAVDARLVEIAPSGSAAIRPRVTSPVSPSNATKVICAPCTSNPAYDRHRGLL